MSTKAEERKAFNKLKKAFPDESVNLQLYYWRFSPSNEHRITYQAFVNTPIAEISDDSATADEAVENLIKKVKGEKDGSE